MSPKARSGHWFEELADHMGPAYLRYSFTQGTAQEVEVLIDILGLEPGDRVLDVGCGPGRHALALAERGMDVVGVDISETFIAVAEAASQNLSSPTSRAQFHRADARDLDYVGEFDAVISLCQGAFGLSGGKGANDELPRRELDESILAGMAQALKPDGKVAVSAFSAYFQVQYLEDGDRFDAQRGVNLETTTVRDQVGEPMGAELWTTCFTPRELRLLARIVGLRPLAVYGVAPGKYGRGDPSIEQPEFLLLAASV